MTEFECDTLQGMRCDPDGCKGACAPASLGQSYVGCDYFPTVTLNPVWSGFSFAVAVSNVAGVPAHVTVTRGATTVSGVTVDAHGIAVIKLPWVSELKGGDVDACQMPPEPGATRIVAAGAYRLRSDNPVTVYQYSPLTYYLAPVPTGCPVNKDCGGTGTQCLSYSNDASLLLPTNVLSGNYTALSWPSQGVNAGFIAVTATANNTEVELIGTGRVVAGAGIPESGSGKVVLNAGDVLEVVAAHDATKTTTFGEDISGTRIRASAPVQVISGHSCGRVPEATTGYCDHLEQGIFPSETLGQDYLVTYPGAIGGDSAHLIRIAATSESTHVKFDPPIVADTVLSPGQTVFQIPNVTRDVHITADKPILVGQYMLGSTAVPSGKGDPSLTLAIPTEQFRSSYLFFASSTYDENYVNVIAPAGAIVTLDGQVISSAEFSAIGTSGFQVARHLLTQTDSHTIESGQPFGIVVYGYGMDTSYMYPGGLDLKYISPPPIY